MTVKELISKLTIDELVYWIAYYNIEPFGAFRTDLNAATVATSFRGGKVSEYMPKFGIQEKPDPEQLSLKLQNYFKGMAANQ